MSTVTENATQPAPSGPTADPRSHVSFPRLVRSEWIKTWTLRSTVWTLALSVVAAVGIAALFAAVSRSQGADLESGGPGDASGLVFISVLMAQLGIAVLGVLAITGEYSTGMIRSTLTATPARLPVLWAKALVLALVTFLAGLLAAALIYLVTLPILAGTDFEFEVADPATRQVLFGVGLYFMGVALFSFAVGALLRHSAAALGIVIALFLVIQTVWANLPVAFFYNTGPFLPGNAGLQLLQTQELIDQAAEFSQGPVLGPWQGFGVLLAWVAVLLAMAAILLKRRDA